jgi:hypothetical protein
MGMIMARSTFLKPLHLPALLLVFGDILVSLAVSSVTCRDGAFLLLARLTQQGAQALNLELELATAVVVFGDGLGDLFVLVFPVVEIAVRAVAGLGQSADFRLENNELVLEV